MVSAPVATYQVEGRSSAAPETVFGLIADATSWQRWAGPLIIRSWWEREGEPAPGGIGAIRRLGLGAVSTREEIVAYEPPTALSYRILSGLPVRSYLGRTVCAPDGSGGTRITWSAEFTPLVPGTAGALTATMRLVIGGFVRRVARAAEQGDR